MKRLQKYALIALQLRSHLRRIDRSLVRCVTMCDNQYAHSVARLLALITHCRVRIGQAKQRELSAVTLSMSVCAGVSSCLTDTRAEEEHY